MINKPSFDSITALGRDFIRAAEKLEEGLRGLSAEADAQLAEAAEAFLTEHRNTNKGPTYATYAQAHRELAKASVAALNIRETLDTAVKARNDSRAFVRLQAGGQFTGDMRRVCDNAPSTPRVPLDDPGSQAVS